MKTNDFIELLNGNRVVCYYHADTFILELFVGEKRICIYRYDTIFYLCEWRDCLQTFADGNARCVDAEMTINFGGNILLTDDRPMIILEINVPSRDGGMRVIIFPHGETILCEVTDYE